MLLIWSQSCGRLLRPRVLVAATLHLGRVLGDALGPSVLGTVLVRGELHGAWDEMRSLEVLLTLAEEGGWAAASKATWAYVALKALMGQDAVDVATWVASAMHER